MKIIEIAFQGYKAYKDEAAGLQRLTLAPLTLVFGKNNSGKSAAVRAPRLLLGGLECHDDRLLPLDVRGLSYGGRFLDVIHGGAFFGRPSFRILATHQGQTLDFTVTLFIRNAFAADEPPQVWSYDMRSPDVISIAAPASLRDPKPAFAGLLPSGERWDMWRKAAGAMLDSMVHLGPTRAPVFPAYANEQFAGFHLNGSGAVHLLRLNGSLADDAGDWYATHMEGWRLSLRRDGESFSLWLKRNGALSSNLAYGDEGLQQALPVVVHQLWRQQSATLEFLDLVEQPEIHLHAAAQAPLADLFIETALQGRGQTIVETNSKAMLLRLQRRIAEGRLRPDQAALYFVEMTEEGSRLRPVGVEASGELEWWPSGVFEEDFGEVAAIRRAQRDHALSKEQS